MASRGRGRRGRPWGSSRPPSGFDQQAFVEAKGAPFTTIAHTSVVGSQGGSSDFQRFRAHHPLTFRGGWDPVVANHWFRQVERVLEAMKITSDVTWIRLAAFQLKGESQVWWDRVSPCKDRMMYI